MRRAFILLVVAAAQAAGATALSAQTATVVQSTNLRSDLSSGHAPIRLLKPSEPALTLLDTAPKSGYYHVRTSVGEEGYVWSQFVSVIAAPKAAAARTEPAGVFAGLSVAVIALAASTVALGATLARSRRKHSALVRRFSTVVDVEAEAQKARDEAAKAKAAASRELQGIRSESDALRSKYAGALSKFEELEREVESLEEHLESIEAGLYQPHFTYADSESYKRAINNARDLEKLLIKQGRACYCSAEWTVGGSRREGERMVKQNQRLILRAFNAESEAAVANVSWNNYGTMRQRVRKAYEALNKQGTVLQVRLSEEYLKARLDELQLVYEAAEKRHQEREEERRQRAEQREEEKAQRELLREQEKAAQEEAKYQEALEKAQQELQAALASERAAMEARIRGLEADLAAAQDRKERAVAQAQLTKIGHVYIISNVGTLGEGVVKIGLTRRLDPEERVHELGDASVPFPFDVHAMIYSENAPELESRLQEAFWGSRLNWANDRKEFFRVSLDDIEQQLAKMGLQMQLARIPEAREYRQTIVARDQRRAATTAPAGQRFPEDPFAAVESSAEATPPAGARTW